MDRSRASAGTLRLRNLRAMIAGGGILLSLLSILGVLRSSDSTQAHTINPGPGSPVVGIDMVPGGSVDACVQVPNFPGAEFTIDVWLNAVPNDLDLDGYSYLLNFPDTATSIVGQDHSLMIPGGIDLSQGPPVTDSPYGVTVANLSGTTAPGGTEGVLGRYTMEVLPDAISGLHSFSLDPTPGLLTLADSSTGADWWYDPPSRGADIWDSNHIPQYGLLALGVPCGGTTTPAPTATPFVTPTPTPTGSTPSPTPIGQTPTPTPSGTTTTPTPTPTPTSQPGLMQGNVDCDDAVDSVDALKVLRYVAHLPVQQNQPCPEIEDVVASLFGDVDCNGAVTSVDALKVLRYVAQLSVAQTEPCPDIGTPLN